MPCPGPLLSSDLFKLACDLCLFSYPDVCFSVLAAGLFFAWLECPCFRSKCHCWKYTRVVDLSFQACSNVTIEDVVVLGECCPCSRDSSLNLLVLVFVSVAVSLSQADLSFNVFDLSVVDIYCCVVFHHHL